MKIILCKDLAYLLFLCLYVRDKWETNRLIYYTTILPVTCTSTCVLKSQLCMILSCFNVRPRHSPYFNRLCTAAVVTIFTFSITIKSPTHGFTLNIENQFHNYSFHTSVFISMLCFLKKTLYTKKGQGILKML